MHFKLNVYSVVLSFGVFQSWNILAHLLPVVFTCSQAAKTASMVFGQAHSLVHSFMSCNVFSTCHVFIGSLSSYQFCSLIGWCSLSCYSILFSSSCFVIGHFAFGFNTCSGMCIRIFQLFFRIFSCDNWSYFHWYFLRIVYSSLEQNQQFKFLNRIKTD